MAEITQDNFRSLLPVKEANVIMKIKRDKKLTLKEAYRTFFASETYRQLETEETKRWWQGAEEILRTENKRFAKRTNRPLRPPAHSKQLRCHPLLSS